MAKIKLKFKGHGTFFIRKGWLGKGIRAVGADDQIFNPANIEIAMDELGLGKNMVGSLRYWLKSLYLIEETGKGKDMHAKLTEFGRLVNGYDPYIEEIGTLWALHCILASEKAEATSWYWLFNEYGTGSISKEDFVDGISKYELTQRSGDDKKEQASSARSSFESDFECIINTYISHERRNGKRLLPESVIDCPLGELGILEPEEARAGVYRKRQASAAALPSLLVLFAILNAVEKMSDCYPVQANKTIEIPIDDLLNGRYSPGRLFNLDSVTLLSKLYELENDEYVRINRTAGTDVVRVINPMTQWECLTKYYELIG